MVDEGSLNLLHDQALKLLSTAATAEEWNRGKYGATIRFCDSYTFSQVSKLWRAYALRPSDGQAFKEHQEKLRHGFRRAREIQNDLVGGASVYSGLRSAAPRADVALKDVDSAYETFWKTGSSRQHQQEKLTHYNPMFSTIDPRYVLHYGTDPVIGYHLATAYIGLSGDSLLKPDKKKAGNMGACFSAAFSQFLEFMKAVQKSAATLTVRFVISDALALCHTLQHAHVYKGSRSAGWYRGFRTWEPLVLDTDDYSSDSTKTATPLLFDVIDTSNLTDHLGCLNLLTGASPLLKLKPTSTLSTEILVKRKTNIDEYKKELLHGDIPTVALLLSISPVEIWTGTTAVSGFDERLVMEIAGSSQAGQSRFVLHWKSTASHGTHKNQSCSNHRSPLTFEPKELAKLLFQMFQGIFHCENPIHWLSDTENELQREAYSYYTRPSFVAILGVIRRQSMVDWDNFMRELYNLIMVNMQEYSLSYMAEMMVYMDLLGLRPVVDSELITRPELSHPSCPLRHWASVPSIMCVTMVVPRKHLGVFKNMPIQNGSPIVQMVLRALDLRTQTYYMNIQAAFGHIKTVGDRYSENLALEVENDDAKWDGRAPLIVSATVPSSVALQKLDLSTEVIFALSHSPHAIANFGSRLGLDLAISRSTLASEDVYITKHRPNMSTHISFSGIAATSPVPEPVRDETQIQFHAQLTTDQSRLASIMAHVDIAPGKLQDTLRSGAGIQVSQVSTFEISISFTNGTMVKRVQFPIPISITGGKTRIARKSSYVEYIAPVPSQKENFARPDSLYPIVQEKGLLGLRTPHYVSLDQSPILGRQSPSQMSWLSPRLADMFSVRERKTRETHLVAGLNHGDTRISFKDSLVAMFSRFTGTNGAKHHNVLCLNMPQQGGVHVIIFVSSIRLDMSCQNLVMDTAVLPLSMDIMEEMVPIIEDIQELGIVKVTVDEKELELWKHALPAMVERCRSWHHKPSCEYAKIGNIPITTEFAEQFLCSCGRGKFPPGYKVNLPGDLWTKASKYAVRAAISPCFSVPLIEQPFEMKDVSKLNEWRSPGNGIDAEITEKLDALRLKSGSCFRCNKRGDAIPGSLLRCGGCKVAEYCSKDCQKADWKQGNHKEFCMLLK